MGNQTRARCLLGIFVLLVLYIAGRGDGRTVASKSQKSDGAVVEVVSPQFGNSAMRGGTPTIRKSFVRQADAPNTTNDESNDQPLGHFGTRTITVLYVNSGNEYPVDADVDGNEVKRIYFENGGWVDFSESDIDSSGNGSGTDEQGRQWEFHGFTDSPVSSIGDEEEQVQDE